MVNLKSTKPNTQPTTLDRRGLNHRQLLLLILISILLHGLGLVLWATYQRPQYITNEQAGLKPVDFTVLPEEPDETITESGTNDNPPPEPEPEPESKTPPPPPTPEPPTPPTVPEPQAVVPEPEPQPVEPPVENQAPVLSGEDKIQTSTPEPEPEPEPEPVATNQPATSKPVPIPETTQSEQPPQDPNEVSTSASDLLGGDFEKTLASSGDAFFSPEALTHEAVLDPQQLQALQGFDLEGYQRRLYERVKRNWKPAFSEKYTTWLTFNIEKNGHISQLQVTQSSGSAEFDQIAVDAVNNATPLEPLPADFPLEHLEFKYQFYLY